MNIEIEAEEITIQGLLNIFRDRVEGPAGTKLSFLEDSERTEVIKSLDRLQKATEGSVEDFTKLVEVAKLHDSARKLWRTLYQSALRRLDPDTRGLSELDDYVHRFVQFEDFLYDSVHRYRDHIVHSLWTYLLGEFCLSKFSAIGVDMLFIPFYCRESREGQGERVWGDLERETITSSLGTLPKYAEPIWMNRWYPGLSSLYSARDSIWAIAALLHDIGYPLTKVAEVEKTIRETLRSFGPFPPSDMDFHWSPIQAQSVANFTQMSSEFLEYTGSVNDLVNNTVRGDITIRSEPYVAAEVTKSLEEYEHGALSAYLLYRLLRSFKRLYVSRELHPNESWWFRTFLAKQAILNAIASHSSKSRRYDFFPQLSVLLFLVDELEDMHRIYKREGEKGYRIRPFKLHLGVKRERIDEERREGQKTVLIGIKVVDLFKTEEDREKKVEDPRKGFALRFSRLFHLLNCNRVAETGAPIVIHMEYRHDLNDLDFTGEMKFLGDKVGIFLSVKEKSQINQFTKDDDVERFFSENGVKLMQPWESTRIPVVTLST